MLRAKRRMRIPGHPRPFYVSCLLRDDESWRIEARYGSLLGDTHERHRSAFVDVRVGSYRSDQVLDGGLHDNDKDAESYDYVDLPYGRGEDGLRHGLWRLAEARNREAVESLLSKRSHALNYLDAGGSPAFERRAPIVDLCFTPFPAVDREAWGRYVERVSAGIRRHREIHDAHVEFEALHTVRTFVDAEGTRRLECHVAVVARVLPVDARARRQRVPLDDQAQRRRPDRAARRAALLGRDRPYRRQAAHAGPRAHDPLVLRPGAARARPRRPVAARGGRPPTRGQSALGLGRGAHVRRLRGGGDPPAVPVGPRRSRDGALRGALARRPLPVRRRGCVGRAGHARRARQAEGVLDHAYQHRPAPPLERPRAQPLPRAADQPDGRARGRSRARRGPRRARAEARAASRRSAGRRRRSACASSKPRTGRP